MSPYRNPRRDSDRISPEDALAALLNGNARFIYKESDPDGYELSTSEISESHVPIAGILGCADARLASEMIFDQSPGSLFMVRLAGNFLSEGGLASMEYAVDALGVPLLMVLGHTSCGAVTAAVNVVDKGLKLPGSMFVLIDALEPSVLRAREENPADLIDATARENVRRQVERLRTISPIIRQAIENRRLMVVGAMYDLPTGRVEMLDC